jgi:hypothetical protein
MEFPRGKTEWNRMRPCDLIKGVSKMGNRIEQTHHKPILPGLSESRTLAQRVVTFPKKIHKNTTKEIDPRDGVGLRSARRHDGGRPRDKLSIAVLTSVKPPDRLFSPLETSSLTVWLSGNRAKTGANWCWRSLADQVSLRRGKRLNCALRVVGSKGSNLKK